MTARANSVHARDIASVVHPGTDLFLHQSIGPQIIARGKGVCIYDDSGKQFLDACALAEKIARRHRFISRFASDRSCFSPPLSLTEAEIDSMIDPVGCTLDDTLTELRSN